eukprot:TRINITY_DN16836_c0_g1_i1.p1 TRINITY_DN16836_c0_g1~~TRINITY_DN16836_c0_g1_i1.p1  ORF type:complete len:444 (+),score=93.13 TRINITY_DN16836_c0_g1_i1:59-1333(+)
MGGSPKVLELRGRMAQHFRRLVWNAPRGRRVLCAVAVCAAVAMSVNAGLEPSANGDWHASRPVAIAAVGALLAVFAVYAVGSSPLASAIVQFALASAGMTVGNKLALESLRDPVTASGLPSTLVGVQVVGTLVLLAGVCRSEVDFGVLNKQVLKLWFPLVSLFAGMLYTSAKTFVYANVTFVLVIRNLSIIATTLLDHCTRGTVVTCRTLAAEALIVCGVVLYGWEGKSYFKDFWRGLVWCLLNMTCQTCYTVLLKHKMESEEQVKDMSKYTMSFLNNLLSLPYFVGVAVLSGESRHYATTFPAVTSLGWCIVVGTVGAGMVISTAGFGLQKLVSATTFLVTVNMVKVLNICLGFLFLKDRLPGVVSTAGCVIALAGGGWYSWEMVREQRAKAALKAGAQPPTPGLTPASDPTTARSGPRASQC